MMNKELIKNELSNIPTHQKAALTVGKDFWHGPSWEPFGPLLLTDGPNGLRKQIGKADHLGLNESVPATCFPTSSCLACSFDETILYEVGASIGGECVEEKVDILLGPGVNIKRSPLGGRNFEYYSEDPYLSGRLAAAFINGVQSTGVGACIKHFACNNQEYARMVNNSIVDERTLHELYLKSFEIAVHQSKPVVLMSSYNQINGIYACEHEYLLKRVLREEWDYKGMVVSDWGGVHDKIASIKAGLNLEMPASQSVTDVLVAIQEKHLQEEELDAAIVSYLDFCGQSKTKTIPIKDPHLMAYKAALESMVLLKNDHQVLPILPDEKIHILGNYHFRIQGAGSSLVHPKQVDDFTNELEKRNCNYDILVGNEQINPNEKVICFIELEASLETEGCDRKNLKLSKESLKLVHTACCLSHHVIVVLTTGSVVELPFIDDIDGLLLTYLPGEAGASAVVSILLGEASPCGHLAESWCKVLEDNPILDFGLDEKNTIYKERFFVGYRYYDKTHINPLFPFGYGLSYTSFVLSNAKIEHNCVTLKIKNTGHRYGKVAVQLYVHDENDQLLRPVQELKAFQKVGLEALEEKDLIFKIEDSYFEYFDTSTKQFQVSGGKYEIRIGFSSRELPVCLGYQVEGKTIKEEHNAYFDMQLMKDISVADFEKVYGKLPLVSKNNEFTLDSTMSDIRSKRLGRIINWFGKKAIQKRSSSQEEYEMSLLTFLSGPIRLMGMGLNKTSYQLEGIVMMLNGHLWKGILRFLRKDRRLQHLKKKK